MKVSYVSLASTQKFGRLTYLNFLTRNLLSKLSGAIDKNILESHAIRYDAWDLQLCSQDERTVVFLILIFLSFFYLNIS